MRSDRWEFQAPGARYQVQGQRPEAKGQRPNAGDFRQLMNESDSASAF